MKIYILFLILAINTSLNAQQQLSFSFGEVPQNLMLNPGAETNFRSHYGIPVFSNLSFTAGFTGFTLADLFLNDSRDFNLKFEEVLNKIDSDDYININTVVEVLSAGLRLDDKTYVSFGFYEELDLITYLPKDITELVYYGNEPFLNRPFSISELVMKADMLGVLHAGMSRKVDEKLTIGGRLKIYSSSLNIETNNNSGTITATTNNTNIIRQTLDNLDAEIRTSGITDSNGDANESFNDVFSNTLLGGNLGLGFDVGLTYHFSPQLEFTGSIIDVGFIKYSKNIRNYTAKGNYILDGINFEYNSDDPSDYWEQLEEDFNANVPTGETENTYTSRRPMKINAALKYSFGEKRSKFCYTKTHKQYYYNSIGFQIHTIMRPLKPQLSFTSFYEKSFSKKIHTKFTHTINDYSAAIFGVATSLRVGKLNIFGVLDNILAVTDLASANNISLNFGFNIVIN
ncbi:MAG: DUF5723 family protein [Flavobacteriaceae bacterium]|nr:DUF5723 family protein [Flavobacteriaceae bacterium]